MLPDNKKNLKSLATETMDKTSQNNRIELLQSMPIFGGIRADTLSFLLENSEQTTAQKNAYFYHENDKAHSLFVLTSGKVNLVKSWQDEDYVLKEVTPGNCFGEVALIDLQTRNTSSLAVENSCAIELTDETLHKLYKREIEQFTMLRMNMAREVCRRLREADSRNFAADIQARQLKHSH
ncbi:MAG: Crp/Fnr family transcriptional regulator [Gammaproteobacteria bacterium]